LDWDQTDNKTTGFRYIVFGATYYVSSAYTENMDLPLGRSYMQYAGASLGFFSILPLTSIIGIENWSEIDPDGKVSTVYSMVSVPYGVITADRLYKKWDLNNGQSYLVSLGVNLGILNTVGLIQQTEWAEWAEKNPENFWRWTSSLTYSGALLGGYLAKNMAIKTSSITEGDVGFLNASMNLGIFNSFLLGSLIDFDNYKSQTLLTMAGVNGFLYLGSHLNKSYGSLSQGQEKIVILGMAASYLAWIGCALVTDFDYASDAARVLDMASLTGGWYFSRRSLKKENSGLGHNDHGSVKSLISFYPQLVRQNNLLVPGVGFSIRF
jgi:predicted acyltransferase